MELSRSSGSEKGSENRERKIQPELFLTEVFKIPWSHGRPRLRVMDVHTEMLIFPGFRGLDRSSCPWTSAGISAWTPDIRPQNLLFGLLFRS